MLTATPTSSSPLAAAHRRRRDRDDAGPALPPRRPQPPPRPAGAARTAEASDRDLLLRWFAEFHDAIGDVREDDFGAAIDDRLAYGGITLWEIDGEPVSMAARSRAEAGMVRVRMVYTPAVHRGHGYGGAATSAVSRAALDEGATDVVLFTDLANRRATGCTSDLATARSWIEW
jgi:predicted GNAT family acetyltransferase